MKRMMISLLGAVLVGAPSFAAMAQTAEQPAQDASPQATQSSEVEDVKKTAYERNCVRYTGSRIQQSRTGKEPPCRNVAGRSYSGEDLDRTGRTNVADALRTLDPSIH